MSSTLQEVQFDSHNSRRLKQWMHVIICQCTMSNVCSENGYIRVFQLIDMSRAQDFLQ